MRNLIWLLILLLIFARQDFWYWEDETLVFGFFPIGFFYQALISVAAGVLWYLATIYCWPRDLIEQVKEEVAGEGQ
ncbi:MAG: DUF3311 domain-containing protein [Pirellulaceae bacterium]